MDLDEWEILPRAGFLDHHDGGKKSSASAKRSSNTRIMFEMDYFVCPSSPPRNSRIAANQQLVRVPFQFEPTTVASGTEDQEEGTNKKPIDIKVLVPSTMIIPEVKGSDLALKEADQDPISQVFFKKMKENKFVDMKMDSPESPTKGFMPPPQIEAAVNFNFEDKSGENLEKEITSPRKKSEKDNNMEVNWEENSGGLNLWKWSLNGIGAICSFGVATVTVFIIVFGSHRMNKQNHHQKLQFHFHTDDKRIRQVDRHGTRLNEAVTAVRQVADINYSGCYEGF